MEILINGHKYLCIPSERYSAENTVPEHTLEDGAKVSDHIRIGAPTFDLTLKLFPGEWDVLYNLQQQQTLFQIVMPQGVYEHVALTKLSDTYGGAANTTQCTVTLEVLRFTSTETKVTELDGRPTAPPDTTGQQAVTVVEESKDITVNQLKEYYLNEVYLSKGFFVWHEEQARIADMPTDELMNYLIEVQEHLALTGYLEALQYDKGEIRHALDLPTDFFEPFTVRSMPIAKGATFTLYDSSNKPTTYTIYLRSERTAIFSAEYRYHTEIRRKADGAIMYNGLMTDLTPFCMTDPKTYIKVAVLQLNLHLKKIYVTTNVTPEERAAANVA